MQSFGHDEYDHKPDSLCNEVGEIECRSIPQSSGARPIVNPHAEGNVDPNLYPQPEEATHKIRGKNDFIEYLFGAVDQELLTVKTFYFFFYSAFGSLFPLMGVYFKQMGMNAGQCGLLIGLRPFIEFLSAPFWGSWADRWQKGKLILLASLSCWIIFTLPLGFIQPPATSCMIYTNHTNYLYIPNLDRRITKRSLNFNEKLQTDKHITKSKNMNVLENLSDHVNHDLFYNDASYINKQILNQNLASNSSLVHDNKERYANELIRTNISADLFVYKEFENNLREEDSKKNRVFKRSYGRLKTTPVKIVLEKDSTFHRSLNENSNSDQNSRSLGKLSSIIRSRSKITNEFHENLKQNQHNIFKEYTSIHKRSAIRSDSRSLNSSHQRSRRNIKSSSTGQSPLSVSYAVNYKENEHKGWVKPVFSSIVYRLPDIQKTFFLLLLLVIVGEFFAAPAITLADSAVLTLLGEDADRYGHQRMFGSLGWGLAMFFVGIALDHSTSFPDHPCGPDIKEKNYTICFAIFSVLMGAALITATQINFKYEPVAPERETNKISTEPTREEQLQSQLSQQLNLPGLQDTSTHNLTSQQQQPVEDKTKMFAQTTREIPEWVTIFKQFKDIKCASFLFVAWFMGFGIGLIFTFLFWHLQDYGGTPTLFGVASVINHISEIFAYFFSFKLIHQVGHVKVLCLGLGGNVLRFLYISWLRNPWWVLPFEFIQGITHAAVWAACCSYIAHNTPTPLRSSAQGVLQGLHHGLGRGCGAVIGGMFVSQYGTTATFRAYGLICLVVLIAFIFINFYRKDTGFVSDLPQTEDPHQVAEVTHLAPHGVPSNAIPRALSSNRLHDLTCQDPSYGATYQTASGNLDVPAGNGAPVNPNNPFLNDVNRGGYNYSLNKKGNDEFIWRSFQTYNEVLGTDYDIMKMPPVMTHLHAQQPCTNPFHQHDYDW